MTRPLLLLDVDGVLNPDTSRNAVDHNRLAHRYVVRRFFGFRLFLSREHGPMLLDFAREHDVELVWATTWEHDANRLVGPVVGLPELPVIEFGFDRENIEGWKFPRVRDYAAGRPLAWLDDDFAQHAAGRDVFLDERGAAATLLHTVPAVHGLRVVDLDAVAAWLRELPRCGGSMSAKRYPDAAADPVAYARAARAAQDDTEAIAWRDTFYEEMAARVDADDWCGLPWQRTQVMRRTLDRMRAGEAASDGEPAVAE